MTDSGSDSPLRRALGLPLLVFYGLGVTIGAGIFALIGEVLGLAGDFAPFAFLIAGVTAAATARAFALLAPRYPKAGGGAVYVSAGIGPRTGLAAGLGVVLTGIVSSATITVAFAGYVGTLVPLATPLVIVVLLTIVTAVAAWGVKESVIAAAIITVIEVGTLAVVVVAGMPLLIDGTAIARIMTPPTDGSGIAVALAGAAVAFFAFIGFEDIVNMAEETKKPERVLGRAIGITLVVTIAFYVLIAAVAAAFPEREAIAGSDAPLADLFSGLTGWPAAPISLIATISLINGILVQIVMASRVLYGMARDGLVPSWFGAVNPKRKTPVRTTVLIGAVIAAMALTAPMLGLARLTGYITLAVFTLVNVSLFRLASRSDWTGWRGDRWWGATGAALSVGLLIFDLQRQLLGD